MKVKCTELLDEKALLLRIADGDEKALESFYRCYESRIRRFICTRVNDSVDAADVLHETMIVVWQSAGRFEGRSSVSSWVFSIAYRKMVDMIRKTAKESVVENVPEEEVPGDAVINALQHENHATHLRSCISKLKGEHRMVVELAFFEEMSYREIAIVADCPEGTVKTRMYHAKEKLKRCITRQMGALL